MDTWTIIDPPEGSMEAPTIDVKTIKRKALDVPYASDSPSQTLDIYAPADGSGPFPTIIFVHGGAFVLGEKRDAQLLHVLEGINRGYAVVSVEYRLAGEAKYPAALYDVKAAIRFLRANASKYMIDGNRFALCGDSAGGFYAVMAAATQGNSAFEDYSMGNPAYSSAVSAVVSWFGVFDLIRQVEEEEKIGGRDPMLPDIYNMLLGAQPHEIEGLMYFTNPLHFITSDFPPVLILHGSADKTVPVPQAYLLEEKVREICGEGRAEMDILAEYDHGGIDPRWNEPDITDKALVFLDRFMK